MNVVWQQLEPGLGIVLAVNICMTIMRRLLVRLYV